MTIVINIKKITTPATSAVIKVFSTARVAHTVDIANPTMNQSERRRSYDWVMAKVARRTQKTSPAVLDGIDAHRNTVRTMGGFFAIALSIAVLIVGLLLLVLPGSITGVPGFVLTVIALPTLPLFGVPATGGFVRYFLSLVTSLFLWWVIGHYAARRAIQSTISSWPEWLREFRPLAIGVVLGSIISLALAAAVLGVI
jgi:hypothetical protein